MYTKRKCKDKANIGAAGQEAEWEWVWVWAIMAASFDWCRVVTGPWGDSSACLSTLRVPWTLDTGHWTLGKWEKESWKK